MTKYYTIQPDVAGGWGERTVVKNSAIDPPEILKLHYQFEDWFGDAIIESFPCYIVTADAAARLLSMGVTGVEFDQVEVTMSEHFTKLRPNSRLPQFVWLKVIGEAAHDDFGIVANGSFALVISERALNVLKSLGIPNALVESLAPKASG